MTARRGHVGQLSLPIPKRAPDGRHGGFRPGSGRPRSRNVSHLRRERFNGAHTPLHVTLRLAPSVWNLRSERGFACVRHALAAEKRLGALRVVHFSVQGNHLHLVVEADDQASLARRMQGFGIRLARAVNGMMRRKRGRVLSDRYHARVLGSPREVKTVIKYVLFNHEHHVPTTASASRPVVLDRFSSAPHFLHFGTAVRRPTPARPSLTVEPRTWLLDKGWLRHGPL
jgi:REP element-mobilizing transposase RayT